MRDLDKRNFGLGSRDMGKAAKQAFIESKNAFESVATKSNRFNQFATWAKENHNIKDLRDLTKDVVKDYAEHLRERFDNEELSAKTIHNNLSAVNTALSQARLDNNCRVEARKEADFPEKSGIAKDSRCIDQDKHDFVKDQLSDRLGAQLDLQRELGLRFKESCLLDPKKCLEEAEKNGSIHIDSGTKGGQARDIPINHPSQLDALRNATEHQGNHRSMIPEDKSYREYKNECYEQLKGTGLGGFHGERHTYANERYEELTGYKAPVNTDFNHGRDHLEHMAKDLGKTFEEARELDQKARLEISEELGHHRVSVTNSYLG